MSTTKPSPSHSINSNLEDALKEINSALEGWDQISNHPLVPEEFTIDKMENQTKDLLVKLREQINDLSKD